VRRISVSKSALTTAFAGTAIIGLILLLLAAPTTVRATSSVSMPIANPPLVLSFPVSARILAGGPAAVLGFCLVILALSFAIFFLIGRRAALPIELVRRRQVQFAVDASHELRTPLTVVEGEASLALRGNRQPAEYRIALTKILVEGRRMKRLVDDLMWLARTDTDPVRPAAVAVDLSTIATAAVKRFESVAAAKNQRISAISNSNGPAEMVAPLEWMERLAGVLLDNACRYTPEGGEIRVSASTTRDGTTFTVEDSGPGIPENQWGHVFDRFHRGTTVAGGAGLGLAIGAQVVAETGGTWKIGKSELGGAFLQVRWRRASRAKTSRLSL
jgi:two-component system, OmpR family, sensor histidine kinase CiaH